MNWKMEAKRVGSMNDNEKMSQVVKLASKKLKK